MSDLRLNWYQRADGAWNAVCACGSSLVGFEGARRVIGEAWHFGNAEDDRKHGQDKPACGPTDNAEALRYVREMSAAGFL